MGTCFRALEREADSLFLTIRLCLRSTCSSSSRSEHLFEFITFWPTAGAKLVGTEEFPCSRKWWDWELNNSLLSKNWNSVAAGLVCQGGGCGGGGEESMEEVFWRGPALRKSWKMKPLKWGAPLEVGGWRIVWMWEMGVFGSEFIVMSFQTSSIDFQVFGFFLFWTRVEEEEEEEEESNVESVRCWRWQHLNWKHNYANIERENVYVCMCVQTDDWWESGGRKAVW